MLTEPADLGRVLEDAVRYLEEKRKNYWLLRLRLLIRVSYRSFF